MSSRDAKNSRHRDLATMLAELAGKSSRRTTTSNPARILETSSTIKITPMESALPGKEGKYRCEIINFIVVVSF